LLYFDKLGGRVSKDEAEKLCGKVPGKDCQTLNHNYPARFVSCVTCNSGEHAGRALEFANEFEGSNKSYFCIPCSKSVLSQKMSTLYENQCLCVTTLKDSWICNKHMVNGWKQVVSVMAIMDAWRARKGKHLCLWCNKNEEDVESRLWVCKGCHAPVKDVHGMGIIEKAVREMSERETMRELGLA
jgi:hypothetical protein